jgi:hypothetical protein
MVSMRLPLRHKGANFVRANLTVAGNALSTGLVEQWSLLLAQQLCDFEQQLSAELFWGVKVVKPPAVQI